jgi:predicted ATPase/class 3 adenylate cyclase
LVVEQPSGTVTLVFTDIAGSTRLLTELGQEGYLEVLSEHRRVVRHAFGRRLGYEVDYEGDAFFYAFADAAAAVSAVHEVQEALAGGPVRLRVGIHTGEPGLDPPKYVGLDVHRAARVAAAGHGGQVLLSQTTRERVDADVRDLGEHRLKDLSAPQRLYQLVIPGLDADFPPLKTLENRPTNLPTQPTPLIGREAELERAAELLHRDQVKLLTFTGPGGTGKTRLALQLAADLLEDFPGGVYFVNLAAISDPALVIPTIAQTVAVREQASEPLEQTLAEHLRERRVLLLLDNFEQILAAAPTLSTLLAAAPELKLLVTSRAPLRLAAEFEFEVPPLELPDARRLPELDAFSQYEAVALFIERARAVRAEFEVTNENAPAVAEICVRLDGLPLAIELAAARIRALSPQALLDRLEGRLGLLTGGARDAPERQQTLRRAIDWSYTLLSEPEQRLFAELSVFAGGWDLEAAEAVCSKDGSQGLGVVDGISSLVENSLVRMQPDSYAGERYWMLETIREYGLERLEASGEADAAKRRHAEHFLTLAERARRTMTGEEIAANDAPEERIQGELPNLRATLEWALNEHESELALRLAAGAAYGWLISGNLSEGRTLVSRALNETVGHETVLRAEALASLAHFAEEQGDLQDAETILQQALQLFKRYDRKEGVVRTLLQLAYTVTQESEVERARTLEMQARSLAVEIGDDYGVAEACITAATIESFAGDFQRAQILLDEGLQLYRELDIPRRLWLHQLINMGWYALQRRDFERATRALEEYLAADSWKSPIGIATAHGNLGLIALLEGHRQRALPHFRETLTFARAPRARMTIAEALFGMAVISKLDGDIKRSARLWGAAEAIKKAMGAPLSEPETVLVEQHLKPARDLLGQLAHTNKRREGSAMTLDEAIAYALATDQ